MIYNLFDGVGLIYAAALKGAGDTRFVMNAMMILAVFALIIPTYIEIVHMDLELKAAYATYATYILLLGICFYLRFRQGKWRNMRVIEKSVMEKSETKI